MERSANWNELNHDVRAHLVQLAAGALAGFAASPGGCGETLGGSDWQWYCSRAAMCARDTLEKLQRGGYP